MAKIGLMFSGQGAQHPGMGQALFQSSEAARKLYQEADRILGWSLSELCFNGPQEELTACAHCQPAIFVTSLAALAARQESGMAEDEFVAAGGLSLGELAAVTAAGVVDFENGLKMVAKRGELMDECCRNTVGAMAAIIGCDEAVLEAACQKWGVVIANYNCPGQRIISGEAKAVEACAAEVASVSMKTQMLQVAGAYHSPLMASAAAAFGAYLEGITFAEPKMPLVHNVTGKWGADSGMSLKELLTRQIASSVRWEQCAGALIGKCERLIEFGPGHVLCGLVKRIDRRFPTEATDL